MEQSQADKSNDEEADDKGGREGVGSGTHEENIEESGGETVLRDESYVGEYKIEMDAAPDNKHDGKEYGK
jgi:hypothetical protein